MNTRVLIRRSSIFLARENICSNNGDGATVTRYVPRRTILQRTLFMRTFEQSDSFSAMLHADEI